MARHGGGEIEKNATVLYSSIGKGEMDGFLLGVVSGLTFHFGWLFLSITYSCHQEPWLWWEEQGTKSCLGWM